MKRTQPIAGNFILVMAAVASTMGAVISAFSFEVDTFVLIVTWAVAAFTVTILALFWRVKGLLILLIPALIMFIWRLPEIITGAARVMHFITFEYNRWLFVDVLFPGAEATAYEQTMFFASAGVALAFILGVTICLRRSAFLTILFTLPIVFLAFVLVFMQPDIQFLLILLAVYITLIFNGTLHSADHHKWGVAIFPVLAVAMLFMSIVYVIAPPGNYNREQQIRTIDFQIRNFAARTGIARIKLGYGWPTVLSGDAWSFDVHIVGISSAGTRNISDVELLEVVSSEAGVFYLRGYSMRHFDGSSWAVNSESLRSADHDLARGMPGLIADVYYSTGIGTRPVYVDIGITRTGDTTRNVFYTPYFAYPERFTTTTYNYSFHHVDRSILALYSQIPEAERPDYNMARYSDWVLSRETYLQIDETTAQGMLSAASDAGISPNADRAVIADQVAGFMSSFGNYTLSPLIVPEDEDFALYFLETSRQGYCIHYTTAATLMLRALGVPARFTSGFIAIVDDEDVGSAITITDRYAHSWVEVYYDNIGWLPLEVTPPAVGFGPPDGRPHSGGGRDQEISDFPGVDWWEDEVEDPWMDGYEPGVGVGRPVVEEAAEVSTLLIVVITVAALTVAAVVRRIIIIETRRKRFALADTNASVIYAWRYLVRLSRFRKWQLPTENIEMLALKARFSTHRLTEEEREEVIAYMRKYAIRVFEDRHFFWLLFVRYILGL